MAYLKLATAVILLSCLLFLTGLSQTPLFVLYLVLLGWVLVQESIGQFIYTAVLSLLLYTWLIFSVNKTAGPDFWAGISQLGILVAVNLVMFQTLLWQKNRMGTLRRSVSRSHCLSAVVTVLNGEPGDYREKLKKVTRVIAGEIEKEGLRCRIVVHGEDRRFLPPSGETLGSHLPIEADGETQGTLILTGGRHQNLTPGDVEFFGRLTACLGRYLKREKLWDFYRNKIRDIETSLLLETPTARYD